MYTIPRIMERTSGTQNAGRAAMSRKVFPGSKKTPASRDGSLSPFGSGSNSAGCTGVISGRLYSCRLRYDRWSMKRRAVLPILVLAMCSCQAPEEGHMKVIIGAVLIDGLGGPPLTNSVVVISGNRIAAA